MDVVTKAAANFNGITIAYVMGIVNAAFAAMLAFGVQMTDVQIASLGTLINASLILCVHIGHRVGEATASGSAHMHSMHATTEQTDSLTDTAN